VVLGAFPVRPAAKTADESKAMAQGREFTPAETVRSKVFWLIYAIYPPSPATLREEIWRSDFSSH
jgi:hypothetical protein